MLRTRVGVPDAFVRRPRGLSWSALGSGLGQLRGPGRFFLAGSSALLRPSSGPTLGQPGWCWLVSGRAAARPQACARVLVDVHAPPWGKSSCARKNSELSKGQLGCLGPTCGQGVRPSPALVPDTWPCRGEALGRLARPLGPGKSHLGAKRIGLGRFFGAPLSPCWATAGQTFGRVGRAWSGGLGWMERRGRCNGVTLSKRESFACDLVGREWWRMRAPSSRADVLHEQQLKMNEQAHPFDSPLACGWVWP